MRLSNRVAIVTGAAQGIGYAMAKRLCEEGCAVALLDINEEKVQESAASLQGCAGFRCDVSSPASIEETVGQVAERFGGIDIVVNNAGILPSSAIPDVTEKEWDLTMAINLKGVFFMAQKALPYLKKSAHARVINTSSLAGRMGGFETCLAYSASKGGINALTMGLARQLAPFHINVNAVCPGTTETPITKAFSDEAMARLLTRIPLGRLGKPEDMAAAVAFLASDDAAFITGLLMDVNGGMYMG
ncbi:MAG: SDR family NAD(P)-dependent oxidoreductase [Oscillospiraceae bacterium]|nr:SDR family NAD(P)-dependent oxidoreductase [Oscillospiraceae bacterium]